ncbi:MAG TPA: DUF1704 domain-containing protein [Candidatus Dojkabacteria bacterium]|nr:DUF1704 domain-containing protein [Candidatus Dojkabacteria bacterium]HQF36033.1 DUF1704 domain-containing protein [Candidatus Dojkabacteria bacterium]
MAKVRKVISYKQLMHQLGGLQLPVTYALTPLNLNQEKEKFFNSEKYNPHFVYRKSELKKSKAILTELATISHVEGVATAMVPLLKKIIRSKLSTLNLIEHIGVDTKFNFFTRRKYAIPSLKYSERATKVLRGKVNKFRITEPESSDNKFKYKGSDVVDIFHDFFKNIGVESSTEIESFARTSEEYQKYLKSGNINNTWRIIGTKGEGSSVRVGSKFRVIFVNLEANFTPARVKKLLVHEIGTHVLRSVNGFDTGYEFLGKPTISSYLYSEEGLTLYNEGIYGILTRKMVNMVGLLSYNVYLAHVNKYSFRELYNLNLAFFQPKEAFSIAYKVKRGLSDTGKAGGYTKDAVYLKGYLLTNKRINEDPSIYNKLYAGKIPFSCISLVDKGIIPMPKALLDFAKVKKFIEKI